LAIAGLVGGGLNVAAGAITDRQYNLQKASADFLIGAAFGIMTYGIGEIARPEFILLSGDTRIIGGLTLGRAMGGARVAMLAGLNVVEYETASVIHGEELTVNGFISAGIWGLLGAGVGEAFGYMGRRTLRKLDLLREGDVAVEKDFRVWMAWYELMNYDSTYTRGYKGYLDWKSVKMGQDLIHSRRMKDLPSMIRYVETLTFLAVTTFGDSELAGSLIPIQLLPNPPVVLNKEQ
jgi:hypothetical protein